MDDDQQQHLEQGTALLLACAGGDGTAFQRLYSIEAPRMLALARRFTGESAAADAVQDTFVQVWRNAHRFRRERGSARAWLYSLLRYRLINQQRRGRHVGDQGLPGDDWPDPGPSPEQCSLEADRDRRLRDCLRGLQGDRQRPILMAFYHGFTYEQIAESLAVPLGTIKSRVRSGLKGLQECLRL
ncbi:MAG: RNA polymerase subunit sigma [Alcanivorax sp.]|nr:RNA polymerase subunit sigma [Alcanivorax sp.]MAY12084.1 RNA polymerase subunit sigma [Alcanivorax sp.]MBI54447.1 RNA polymerase subunit sigma [Alcanivorax sp.]HCE41113.1 RNA polymerase subunit sigma [Alcanivorax sp.]|tara:strand:- start:100 stop:654 length:555 start_codon:yes stop_codon:yes gene_type:complete